MWIARFHATSLAVVALLTAVDARAACTDAAAVTAAWSAIDDACPCVSAATRGAHVACATQAVKARIAGGQLPSSCRRDALKHAKLSVCGRPGAAVCCRIATTNGREKHRVVPQAAKCTSTPRVSACVSGFPSVPTGCDAGGCIDPVCGNGVVEPGEECDSIDFRRCDQSTCQFIVCPLPPTTCGNGVVDPGEACEPPGAGACDAECQPAPCGAPLPGEIAVACAEPALSGVSLGAGSDGDGYLIAWTATARRPRTDIVARRFDAAVAPIDAQVRVLSDDLPCGTSGNSTPAVGSDGQSYYTAWSGYALEPSDSYGIAGRRIDGDGTMRAIDELEWAPRVGMCSIIMQGPTAVAGAGADRYVAAWSRSSWCASGGFIPGPDAAILTFAGSGGPTRSAFDIYFAPSADGAATSTASLASLGDDTIAVFRAGRINPTPPPAEEGFILQRWTDPALDTTPIFSAGESVEAGRPVAVAGDGQLLVAWRQVFPPSVDRIVATRVASTGELLDSPRIEIATTPSGVAAGPVAAFDGTVWLVAWVEPNGDLRAVAVRADGTVVDSPPRLLASGVALTEPAVASVGDGDVLVVYGRPDGTATAIRAQLVPGV